MKEVKRCIECKAKEARHWASSYCEECFTVILNEKFEEDEYASIQGDR